jgi:hypothetical protein
MAMTAAKLARAFLRTLASLSVLAAFAVLDWYPTVKDLGRLRRERGDLQRKIKDYGSMTSDFVFPDAEERSLLAQSADRIFQSFPQVEVDAAWLELARADLRERAKGITILKIFGGAETFGPGPAGFTGWLKLQERHIQRSFRGADAWRRYPWRGVFPPGFSSQGQLACRPLGVGLESALPEMLDFINHLSWGDSRLELVRLCLEPGFPHSRAWLVCRGSYLVGSPSAWAVKEVSESAGNNLLVDPDSPLLWQKVVPSMAYREEKRELAAGNEWTLE